MVTSVAVAVIVTGRNQEELMLVRRKPVRDLIEVPE
jgi:hypothetical protein